MEKKYVYNFTEGNMSMRDLLGGKGANLAEMTSLGIPVPPGFTITTEACAHYLSENEWPKELEEQLDQSIKKLEQEMNAKFGDNENPLLISVRSGAAASMPGMMDSVLNLGMNDDSVLALAKKTNNERFAWDAYRRFIQMFGDVTLGIKHSYFEKELQKIKETKGAEYDTDLTTEDLKNLVNRFKSIILEQTGKPFPQNPTEQLKITINAVFGSWNNKRAVVYRRVNKINNLFGTAINIQVMVFGNMGDTSGTGVVFSRDPSTGENKLYGEFLTNAQGEDVVAGIRTPLPISELKNKMPEQDEQLNKISKKLEQHYKDMQDMEFTVQEGKLFMLQTRDGKRSAAAAVKIAVDMVKEGLIDEKEAVLSIPPQRVDHLLHKSMDPIAKKKGERIAKGLPASPGAVVGQVVFSSEKAVELAEKGEKVILVRIETSPEDIEGMHAAEGILTSRGGMTSHAAVVARGMGKCCVAGCCDIFVKEDENKFVANGIADGLEIEEGDFITLNGSTGEVFKGKIPVIEPKLSEDFHTLMKWADNFRKMKVRTNAETPSDCQTALKFGAEGIGLCRTEHMFFEGERLNIVREMILANDVEERKKALEKLLPMQRSDFSAIFEAMKDLPVNIRLLDPPLHEFLPKNGVEVEEVSKKTSIPIEKVKDKIEELHEFNPMLGHRGCRLAITFPEITEMQTKAIIGAAIDAKKKGLNPQPEIMVPLIGDVMELKSQKEIIKKTADELIKENNVELNYTIGTMIEVPRAALTSDEIAKEAEFFSYGTNDLTQMSLGLSRDDCSKFLPCYVEEGIYTRDPFQVIDHKGVGRLVKISAEEGKKSNPNLKIGICGEHGGEPTSIEFCHKLGLDYISCSPYRVPVARLAAAHSALKDKS
jgi:pyruvate,orthophosphate dikinase